MKAVSALAAPYYATTGAVAGLKGDKMNVTEDVPDSVMDGFMGGLTGDYKFTSKEIVVGDKEISLLGNIMFFAVDMAIDPTAFLTRPIGKGIRALNAKSDAQNVAQAVKMHEGRAAGKTYFRDKF
ncbi:MAG: hypothetical protein JJV99_09570 [Colwellia sp.]|nr:hypothetical protein [Colwellia sp.]